MKPSAAIAPLSPSRRILLLGFLCFHALWTNILTYLRQVDVEKIRFAVANGQR